MASSYKYLSLPTPHLLAHRGGDQLGRDQQNTLAAFRSAVDMGYKYIETDVICSRDGQVVIYHGSKSRRQQRKTGQHRRKTLQSMTYAKIKKFFQNQGIEVPTLEETLREFPDTFFNIDAKTWEVVEPLAKTIAKLKATDRVCIASFSHKRTLAVAKLLGGQKKVCTSVGPRGFSALLAHSHVLPAFSKQIDKLGVDVIQVPYRLVTKKLIKTAHNRGILVHAWTVNNPKKMKKLLELGVDGIVTDKTKMLYESTHSD